MSRKKASESKIVDKENIKQKKLSRLLMKINIFWAIFAFVGIIIGAVNQYNQIIVGMVAISEGILGILLFISHMIILKRGLFPLSNAMAVLLEANAISFSDPSVFYKYEEELENAKFGHYTFLGIIIFLSVIAIVAGVLKIFSLI